MNDYMISRPYRIRDISLCAGACENNKCARNVKVVPSGLKGISFCDFTPECKSYKRKAEV